MAMPLRIPKQHEKGLARIRDLSSESAQELVSALPKMPATINQDSLSSAVASMVDTIAASDVEEMVPALLTLYALKNALQSSVADVAESTARWMEESAADNLRSSPEYRDAFELRLADLLSVDQLNTTARAGGLLFENEHSLVRARIVTDIRPVFEPNNPKATPKGAVIVHTLKISYLDDNETKEFFVALDTNDVDELSKQLERANLKAESLESILAGTEMRYMDAK
jgi:hypothetical protein